MSPIDVEPAQYDAASKVMGQKVVQQLTNAVVGVKHSLADTGAMAGTDPGGISWASSYDPAVAATTAAMTDLTKACYKLAAILEQTGFNHGLANSASDPTKSTPTPPDTIKYEAPPTLSCDPDPPSAAGGSGHPPKGWGLIEHLVGYVWPNGDQGKLRKAAQAWNTAAGALNDAAYDIPEAIGAIITQRSPEVDDAQTVCQAMMTHIEKVSSTCGDLSTACSDLADHIDKAHKDIEDELISLVEWTVAIEAAGAVASFFSFGAAEVPTQAAEAARIGTTATRVGKIISTLVEFAGTVASRIGSVVTKIGEIASRLKVILRVAPKEVEAEVAEEEEVVAARNLENSESTPPEPPKPPETPPREVDKFEPKGFHNETTAAKHFRDHGSDFGSSSVEEYEQGAQRFLKEAQENNYPARVDQTGRVRIYNQNTNTFAVYDADGSVVSYYKPSSPTYWERNSGNWGNPVKWK